MQKQWAAIAPQQVRLDELVTTKRTLDLEALLEEDSTFYGDPFAHVVSFEGDLYLEDGLQLALRRPAAAQARPCTPASWNSSRLERGSPPVVCPGSARAQAF